MSCKNLDFWLLRENQKILGTLGLCVPGLGLPSSEGACSGRTDTVPSCPLPRHPQPPAAKHGNKNTQLCEHGTVCQMPPKCFLCLSLPRWPSEDVLLLPTLQVRKLSLALIIVEGLGLSPRCCGFSVFAFKYYSATSQCSIGICVPALKGGGSREGTETCPLCCRKLTHWKHKPTELISYTNGMQAGRGCFFALL